MIGFAISVPVFYADTNNNVMSVDLFWLKSNTSGKEVKIF
ncbi:hypothetical protein LTSEADE_2488 [Salmonella enterica subsp. enterica serovar Adelaide str. A4-669]|uniref:Uncharacterized protein n=1 Tax=Salmonella enterica subsp. enterica serovar Adelaide str. A4-669 TaxID=913063 RepID=A0A6C8GN52_SALET|nr:hypothetical protein STBHUCCB_14860 [Salmonella enterica subsp. enterica serovar Typhi str. P-stx-12]AXR54995.1 hypothetical protein CJP42_2531 [Salmonella enterica subsp. enterica serovar Typhi]EHC36491.1 hypothetical protein LTSEADE_2488 [Salmonella enterica subsp. enterica serovar Adelaide str. A4-669]EHC71475.1 hypothetical protein LTSEMIS_2416 [Salmonella enterica subsp. enterica serovar Mississippi str. A4-633]EHJ82363.1 hypothetical protein LTSEBAI_2732 [Salmonella enterica subsp. ent